MDGCGERRESALSIAIKNFSPIWFIMSMDTGILSIIMNLLPWQFRGLGILATIMFVWNLVLFSVFTLISLIRLFKFPSHVKSESINSVEEISYLATPAIAYLTLIAQVSLTCSTAWGYGLTVLAYVLWWIGLVWTVVLCAALTIQLGRRNIADNRSLPPAVFLPIISVMTLGTVGGIVANYSVGITSREAVPIIIVSFIVIGYGLFLGICYYALFLHRLLAVGPPQQPKTPTLVITVGPFGQFATAIQILGNAASSRGHFAAYGRGTFLNGSAASSLSTACELIALLAAGFAVFWIIAAWWMVIEALVKKRLTFTLSWWSMIFPMGVFTTALINFSIAMDSDAFRGLAAALLILLLVIYFFNLFFSLYRIVTGEALGVPQHREQEKQQEREERENRRQQGNTGSHDV